MLSRMTSAVAAGFLVVALCTGLLGAPGASAATSPRVFANCTQLNGLYPHGVGKVGARDRSTSKNFHPVTTFRRDNVLYQANSSKDRDHDGIACEKR